MGKRSAGDQHEILDHLYTEQTDRLAKKMARQQARAAKRPAREPSRRNARKTAGAITVGVLIAAGAGVWILANSTPSDPAVSADRAACDKFAAFDSPETTTPEDAAKTGAGLQELATTKMAPDLSAAIRAAADGMMYMYRTMATNAPETVTDAARGYAVQRHRAVVDTCEAVD